MPGRRRAGPGRVAAGATTAALLTVLGVLTLGAPSAADGATGGRVDADDPHRSDAPPPATRALQEAGPDPRSGFGLVYDDARDRLVLFGGTGDDGERRGDTWVWDGAWRRLAGEGPPARSDPQMAYDRRRDRVVLYGGGGGGVRYADTWELAGDRWIRVADGGPGPRSLGSMAWDEAGGRVILFGGRSGADDDPVTTHAWDGSAWTRVDSAGGPVARGAHGMAWHGGLGGVVLYGGWGGASLADLWLWRDGAWHPVEAPAGPPRLHAAVTWDAERDRLVVHGGFGEGREADTWEWDGAGWERRHAGGPGAPEARAEHEGVYVPGRGVAVFGGVVGQDMAAADRRRGADLWFWDGRAWHRGGR